MAAPRIASRLATPLRAAARPIFAPVPRRHFAIALRMQVKKYTEDHEWIELEGDTKIGTIGITTYAAKALGDVVYVELPELGLKVQKGDSIGAVESVKSASDIMSPVTGTVMEANGALEEKPGGINSAPEGDGWFAKIEVTDVAELEGLMTAEEYEKFEKD